MEVQPIWVSSVKHLETFYECISSTPMWRKLIGSYKFPKDFPKAKAYGILGIPIVFFSKGKLSINQNSLKFNAISGKTNLIYSYANLKDNLIFEIELSNIKSIEWYQHKNAFIKYYNIKWIRIILANDILGEDILLSVGGTGPSMNSIITKNNELFSILEEKIRNQSDR